MSDDHYAFHVVPITPHPAYISHSTTPVFAIVSELIDLKQNSTSKCHVFRIPSICYYETYRGCISNISALLVN